MSMSDFIKVPKILLTMLALYPKKEASLGYSIRRLFSLLIIVTMLSCLTYHAALQFGDFIKFSESLYLQVTISNGFTKLIILTLKREKFFKCIDMLDTPSFITYNEQYGNMVKRLKTICFIAQLTFVFLCDLNGLCYAIFPIWESKPLPLDFEHFNSGVFHYPFYFFQLAGMFVCAHANMCVDFLSVGFIMLSATQLRKLNRKLVDMQENIKNLPNYSEKNLENLSLEYIKECCMHYEDIEEFSVCLADCFSLISCIQMVVGCVSICNTLMLLTVSPISTEATALITYTFCMLHEIGLYCWFGDFVYHESLEIGTSCYFSPWYECGPRVRRSLFILMERTKRPIEVKGLGLITLNLQTFISILKWTYSYFALLRNMYE